MQHRLPEVLQESDMTPTTLQYHRTTSLQSSVFQTVYQSQCGQSQLNLPILSSSPTSSIRTSYINVIVYNKINSFHFHGWSLF